MDDFAATSPYAYLLDDPDFRRFIQNVRRRSENSAHELRDLHICPSTFGISWNILARV
jgi:hypothetical protein